MNRTIDRVKVLFLGLFLIGSLGMFGYQFYVVWPAQNCEADGGWWDSRDHLCASPMPIWRITGRMPATVAGAPGPPKSPPAKP